MVNLSGRRFGKLFALTHIRVGRRIMWNCICECGKQKLVRGAHLTAGGIRSCGCLQAEARIATHFKHGFNRKGRRQPEYRSWVCMRERCDRPTNNEFHRYGARGITVCERWQSFENFIADMGLKPSPRHSIDRFPNKNGNYEKVNCRWATPKEQARNARSNRIIRAFGQSKTLIEWSEDRSLSPDTISFRLKRGWDIERALSEPSRRAA